MSVGAWKEEKPSKSKEISLKDTRTNNMKEPPLAQVGQFGNNKKNDNQNTLDMLKNIKSHELIMMLKMLISKLAPIYNSEAWPLESVADYLQRWPQENHPILVCMSF